MSYYKSQPEANGPDLSQRIVVPPEYRPDPQRWTFVSVTDDGWGIWVPVECR